jgi:predicted TPR repeat methyltransferase
MASSATSSTEVKPRARVTTREFSATAPPTRRTRGGLLAKLTHAIDLLRSEQIEAAENALQALLRRWPEQPDALHFLGVVRHTQGRVDEAVGLIRRALALDPRQAGAWNNLGNVLLHAGRGADAAQAYERAAGQAESPADAMRALNNLGVLHRRCGQLEDSEAALRRALAIDGDYPDAWYNLSTTLLKQGRIHDGIEAQSRAVALCPQAVQSRQEVIRALLFLDERQRASRLLQEWLATDPSNPVAEHLLAACTVDAHGATPDRASDRYVQQVFDAFAASFDVKLEALHYRAPELVVAALRRAAGEAAQLDIVDAGCGTGLCGPGLRRFARLLAGCDLSVGMLRRARARKAYDVLHQAELTHYLATQPARFDAVVSADTLCYFGALEGAVAAALRSLRPAGLLIFTLEALADDAGVAHRMQVNGRYAHQGSYVRSVLAAEGFDLVALVREDLRLEAGEPVRGWLVTARKPSSAAGC